MSGRGLRAAWPNAPEPLLWLGVDSGVTSCMVTTPSSRRLSSELLRNSCLVLRGPGDARSSAASRSCRSRGETLAMSNLSWSTRIHEAVFSSGSFDRLGSARITLGRERGCVSRKCGKRAETLFHAAGKEEEDGSAKHNRKSEREREKKRKRGKEGSTGGEWQDQRAAAEQKKCALKTHSRTTHARTRTHERKHNVHAPCMRKSRQAAIATNLSGGHGGVALLRCSPTSRPRQTASACGAAVRVARGERVAAASVFDRKSGAWKVTRPVTCRSLAASFRAARTTNRRIPTEPSYFFPAFLRRRPALAHALARARRSAGACVRALLCRLRGNHHKHQHQRRRRHDDEVAHPASNCITLGRVQPPLRSATLRLSMLPHHRSLTTATPPNQSKLPRKSYVGGGGPSVRSFVRRRSFGCSVVRSFVRDGTAREATQPQSNKAH